MVTVCAYSPDYDQCDGTPSITASGLKLKKENHNQKIVALSRDLAKKYEFGDKFQLIVENEVYNVIFHDKMNKKWQKRVDLLIFDKQKCKKFGKKQGFLIKKD